MEATSTAPQEVKPDFTNAAINSTGPQWIGSWTQPPGNGSAEKGSNTAIEITSTAPQEAKPDFTNAEINTTGPQWIGSCTQPPGNGSSEHGSNTAMEATSTAPQEVKPDFTNAAINSTSPQWIGSCTQPSGTGSAPQEVKPDFTNAKISTVEGPEPYNADWIGGTHPPRYRNAKPGSNTAIETTSTAPQEIKPDFTNAAINSTGPQWIGSCTQPPGNGSAPQGVKPDFTNAEINTTGPQWIGSCTQPPGNGSAPQGVKPDFTNAEINTTGPQWIGSCTQPPGNGSAPQEVKPDFTNAAINSTGPQWIGSCTQPPGNGSAPQEVKPDFTNAAINSTGPQWIGSCTQPPGNLSEGPDSKTALAIIPKAFPRVNPDPRNGSITVSKGPGPDHITHVEWICGISGCGARILISVGGPVLVDVHVEKRHPSAISQALARVVVPQKPAPPKHSPFGFVVVNDTEEDNPLPRFGTITVEEGMTTWVCATCREDFFWDADDLIEQHMVARHGCVPYQIRWGRVAV
ncbi:hypothetical protein FN846DRAFT_904431 [Sphaerosporella brunnea]|uniref:Uncharacterized protein n=1 Tax=Sphaerosporella brunnea TaxID=1250544 RepID=A0A5J5F4A5_9PEZI|nr:hypothetical protein FN846DRAFT_904431 [Sphaerosporella brunnea]